MLTSTFCHIDGVGPSTERKLWQAGHCHWEAPSPPTSVRLPKKVRDTWDNSIAASMRALERRDSRYFAERLPNELYWRLYSEFRDSVAFVDIETTGNRHQEITTIALFDGYDITTYIRGFNLSEFPGHLRNYRLLVTYNGLGFDVPLIESEFGIRVLVPHIDLMYPLRELGYRGGLKGCERQVGIDRQELTGVNGYSAVLLWRDYKRTSNPNALETLLAYNALDVFSLQTLLIHVHNRFVEQTPFAKLHQLSKRPEPKNPYTADPKIVRRVVRR
jgi:uncharacterized protein